MKDAFDATAPGALASTEGARAEEAAAGAKASAAAFGNRKLIRPVLNVRVEHTERARAGKKAAPPEQTFAEAFYYQKQMQSRTLMTVVLKDDKEFSGIIEWYDKDCIKLNRNAHQPNLLIYKSSIKYVYKHSEGNGRK